MVLVDQQGEFRAPEDDSFGAVGLGSSNDFHKPVPPSTLVPTRINIASSRFRDVGKITYWQDGLPHTRYFLSNASIGVTAMANHLFNTPGAVLKTLKFLSTPSAIMYAAAKAIAQHRSIPAHLHMPSGGRCAVHLSNLAILKNPHVGGNLRFPVDADYENGRFAVCLFHNMTRFDLLHALGQLRSGGISGRDTIVMWEAQSLSVSSAGTFAVEFDGEVVMTTNVRFEVLPRHLKVCTC